MQKRLREIEEMRASLPLGKYLQLIHIGATTGVIPTINPLTGEPVVAATKIHPTGSPDDEREVLMIDGSPLESGQRLSLLQYLVDKQMAAPNMPQLEAANQSSEKLAQEVIANPSDTPSLPREDLEQIIRDAEFYIPEERAPLHLPPETEVG